MLVGVAWLSLAAGTARGVTPLAEDWHRGAVVPGYHHDVYEQPETEAALADLALTGADHVQLFFHWYMPGPHSSQIEPHRRYTPTDASLLHAIEVAKSHGMSVSLHPVARPFDTWQGNIRPTRLERWFRSYRAMIAHYAGLSEQGRADMLLVGAEFRTLQDETEEWRRVIEVARARFSGELAYASNGVTGALSVRFWRQLDYIAMSAYMVLAGRDPNPSTAALVRAWESRGYVDAIKRLRRRYDRPVLFTEIGYASRKGTASAPWAAGTGGISQTPQRRAYEAAYRVWSDYPWFDGLYWWRWMPGAYNPADGSHSPRGKLAEDVMTAWSTAE